jgi:hypothetical protein
MLCATNTKNTHTHTRPRLISNHPLVATLSPSQNSRLKQRSPKPEVRLCTCIVTLCCGCGVCMCVLVDLRGPPPPTHTHTCTHPHTHVHTITAATATRTHTLATTLVLPFFAGRSVPSLQVSLHRSIFMAAECVGSVILRFVTCGVRVSGFVKLRGGGVWVDVGLSVW